MNEEEKKAIEYMKEFQKDLYGASSKNLMANYLDTIFNLIDNQQKEIEELKERQDYARLEKEQLLKNGISKDKIEVGEYIRTKTGNITKVCKIKDTVVWTDEFMDIHCRYNEGVLEKTDILKHSKNIIDLIEEGDYVNGEEITYINEDRFIKGQINLWTDMELRDVFGDYERLKYTDKDIKTIVTKEQFKETEYRV